MLDFSIMRSPACRKQLINIIPVLLVTAMLATHLVAQSTPDTPTKILHAQEFILSDAAKAAGIDGNVRVSLTVDETGKVKNVVLHGGPAWPCGSKPEGIDDVRKAIKENILAAKFSPAIKNGKPVDSDVSLTFAIGGAYRRAVEKQEAEEAARRGDAPKLVKGGVLNGRALKLPKPAYPSSARSYPIAGAVSVEVLIDEQGNVKLAGPLSGHPLLQSAARDAACDAKFSPTVLSGQPVTVTGVITYNFVPPTPPRP
jgi:TonB family protein